MLHGSCCGLVVWRRKVLGLVLAFVCAANLYPRAQAQKAKTSSAEGAAASTPTLLLPSAVAYDAAGNLFFVDTRRNQVFEVSFAGRLSVVAGTGQQGFAGDGDPAANALFNAPQGIALGADNTVYIADTGNQRIRAISNGVVRTIAGTGTRGALGDGGPAIAAALNRPSALAVDTSGGLLVCDTANHRVRRIASGTITTVAGTGQQGFAGDGSPATAAELDSPMGIAVVPDGRVFVADSHNHRIRVIGTDGTIQTFAGSGMRGFSGDGGQATNAQLFLPRGMSVTNSGDVVFADSDNQRVRSIDAQGIISTIAGDGWQGSSPDASAASAASLDSPRGVAAAPYGIASFADPHNHWIQQVAADSKVYIVASPPARTSSVALTLPPAMTYGQGSAAVRVQGAAMPQGDVALVDGNTIICSAKLTAASASIPVNAISAGPHTFTASYAGDGLNPAATSALASVTVQPADVVASADAAQIAYGETVPLLTGSATGVLPQDASFVFVSFFTSAGALAPAGTYPIQAQLSGTGSGNYQLSMAAGSGALKIVPAQSSIAMQAPSPTAYAGLPLVLNAVLRSATSGTPTGEVDFLDGSTIVAKAASVNGIASATYLAPTAGTHTLTATYAGDGNFLGSTSIAVSATISAIPDFTLAAAAPSQSVQAGLIASYALSLAPGGGPFTGSVTFSVTGLPSGAQASFSPSTVVPGATGAAVTMNVQTPASLAHGKNSAPPLVWIGVVVFCLLNKAPRNRKAGFLPLFCVAALVGWGALGCGARTAASSSSSRTVRSFPLTVTATSTNLAGAIVTHTAALSLTVE